MFGSNFARSETSQSYRLLPALHLGDNARARRNCGVALVLTEVTLGDENLEFHGAC